MMARKKIKKSLFFVVSILPLMITYHGFAQNNQPVISNLSFENNAATKTITIFYDLFDAEETEIDMALRASFNDGQTFLINTDNAQGDIGFPINIGTGKVINWYYGDFWNNIEGRTLRLIADDRYQINVDDIVAQVDSNRLRSMLNFIAQPRSFQFGSAHLYDVRDSIASLFDTYDYSVRRQEFAFESFTGTNVIGRKQGLLDERKTIIMDAHYDAFFDAPGADDNGTGVVGFLEAARILKDYNFEKSLEFIGFDSEENFLLGSINYAYFGGIESWKDVEAVLNYEMVGYFSNSTNSQEFPEGFDLLFPNQYNELIQDSFRGNFIFVVGNTQSTSYVNAFESAAINYVPDLKVISGIVPLNGLIAPDLLRSDHSPFWFRGIPALFITDGAEFRNRDYHTVNDVIGNLDFNFMTNVVKTCLATMIELAGISHASFETFVVEDLATNTNQLVFDCQLTILPNPATELISLSLSDCFDDLRNGQFTIFDAVGRKIHREDITTNQLQLDTKTYDCGQYILLLENNQQYKSLPFIIQQ